MTLSVSWIVSESNSGILAGVALETVSAAGAIEAREPCADTTATQAVKLVNDLINMMKIRCRACVKDEI
jgi:hypothetical protein